MSPKMMEFWGYIVEYVIANLERDWGCGAETFSLYSYPQLFCDN